jgi:hypothetical protein
MSNFKSTTNRALHEWYLTISNKPSTIVRFSYSELDELYSYIEKIRFNLYKSIIDFLKYNPNYTFENRALNTSTYNNTYNEFVNLLKFIKNRMVVLQGVTKKTAAIFNNNLKAEQFFKKLVDEWLSKEKNTKTAISYVFFMMWNKTDQLDKLDKLTYEIVGTQTEFAEFWNFNYKNIYEFKSPKQPKLKTLSEIISKKYERNLTSFLNNK